MLALLAAALVAGAPAKSTPAKAYQACVDAHATNYDWDRCGGAYLQASDKALNAAWARVLARAQGRTRTDLIKEERAWIAYKDASCAFYQNGDWGREGEVLHFFGCRGAVIEQRTAELKGVLDFVSQ